MYLTELPSLIAEESLASAQVAILGNSASYPKGTVDRVMREYQNQSATSPRPRVKANVEQIEAMGIQVIRSA